MIPRPWNPEKVTPMARRKKADPGAAIWTPGCFTLREPNPRPQITTSAGAVGFLRERLPVMGPDADREVFAVLVLDAKHRVRLTHVVAVGSLTGAIVHPRETFRAAVADGAAALILAHNHPSGDPAPSAEDVEITRRLREAGTLLGITVLDHVVLGDPGFFSFCDNGYW